MIAFQETTRFSSFAELALQQPPGATFPFNGVNEETASVLFRALTILLASSRPDPALLLPARNSDRNEVLEIRLLPGLAYTLTSARILQESYTLHVLQLTNNILYVSSFLAKPQIGILYIRLTPTSHFFSPISFLEEYPGYFSKQSLSIVNNKLSLLPGEHARQVDYLEDWISSLQKMFDLETFN